MQMNVSILKEHRIEQIAAAESKQMMPEFAKFL